MRDTKADVTPRPVAGPSYLAVDLGATSGRGVVGTLCPGPGGPRVRLHEVHRFPTPVANEGGRLAWDADALWDAVRETLARALAVAPALRGVSVDSWAVDYVPLDAAGAPVRRPYAYRDPRTHGRLDAVVRRAGGADALYARTGTQFLEFNTLPQVAADVADEPAFVARTCARLFVADWLHYRLSGVAVAERTLASCSQLLDARTGDWAGDVIEAIGDDPARWPPVVPSGTVLGPVLADALPQGFAPAGGCAPLVVAGCAHDTAAAVAAVPADDATPWAFVSSGTWFLVGAERRQPLLTPEARRAGFTNEAGFGGTVRLLKNRTGFWVLEECRRAWAAAGEAAPYAALLADAAAAPAPPGVLDLDAPAFAARQDDMPARVAAACDAAGLPVPNTPAACARLVVESLAAGTARALDELEALTGERAHVVHLVGGGARVALLGQRLADACGRRVVAGPDEAAALGNVLVQARAAGDLARDADVRATARRSVALQTFHPAASASPPRAAVSPRPPARDAACAPR